MALTKSLRFKWPTYREWSLYCADAFAPLWDTINHKFCPTVFGKCISQQEKILFSMPKCIEDWEFDTQWGSARFLHSVLVKGTVKTVQSIRGEEEFSVLAHKAVIVETQARLMDHQRFRGCKIGGKWRKPDHESN